MLVKKNDDDDDITYYNNNIPTMPAILQVMLIFLMLSHQLGALRTQLLKLPIFCAPYSGFQADCFTINIAKING